MGKNDGTQNEIWRTSQGCDGDIAGDGNQQSGRLGEEAENEPLGANYPDWLRQDPHKPGSASVGGVLSQLIEEADDQLVEIEERIDKALIRVEKYREKIEKVKARRQQLLAVLEVWKAEATKESTIEGA